MRTMAAILNFGRAGRLTRRSQTIAARMLNAHTILTSRQRISHTPSQLGARIAVPVPAEAGVAFPETSETVSVECAIPGES